MKIGVTTSETGEHHSHILHIAHPSQLEMIDFGQHFCLDVPFPATLVRMYSGNMRVDDHFLFDFPRGHDGKMISLSDNKKIYHVFYRGPFYLRNEKREGVVIQDVETKLWFIEI